MPIPGTLQVTGQIAPSSTTDTYATHEDKYGKGGYMVVANVTERNAIPAERRKEYMIVRTANDGAEYELDPDLTTWNVPIPSLGGDMTKAVYDTNDDGKVNDADHADTADTATTATTANFATTAGGAPPTGLASGHLTGSYPGPSIANDVITDLMVVAANKDGLTNVPSLRTLGTGAQQAAAGNDSRLSDARIPTGAAGGELSGTYPNPTLDSAALLAHSGDIDHNALLNYDPAEHFLINDGGTGTNITYSADYILSLIAAVSGSSLLIHDSVQTASYTNVASLSGLGTYNSHTLIDGDRIGLNGQTTLAENGIWVAHAGAWTRPTDWDTGNTVSSGETFFVDSATSSVVGDQMMVTTPGPSVIDTEDVVLIRIRRLTLGTGGGQAAAGNDARIPTQAENDALQGTSGSPSNTNRYVTDQDSRLTDSRTPNGAAGGSLGGTYPNPTVQQIDISAAQGSVLYRNASGWVVLAPGTSGQFLTTAGAGANPSWSSPGGATPTGAAGGDLGGTYPNPEVRDFTITGEAQGDILYRNATNWVRLAAGTSGQYLKTQGAAANPTWDTVSPAGAAGGDLQGTYPAPEVKDLTISGEVQGNILFYNGSNWVRLPNGTAGQVLQTNGAGADPTWVTPVTVPPGGSGFEVIYKNANFTVASTDSCLLLSNAGLVITLPAASSFPNETPVIIKDMTGNVSVSANTFQMTGGDTFDDGTTTHRMVYDRGFVTLVSDGISKWTIVCESE